MRTLAAASLPILFTGSLPAQGHVSPAHFRHMEGTASQTFPFGVTTVPNVNVLPTRSY